MFQVSSDDLGRPPGLAGYGHIDTVHTDYRQPFRVSPSPSRLRPQHNHEGQHSSDCRRMSDLRYPSLQPWSLVLGCGGRSVPRGVRRNAAWLRGCTRTRPCLYKPTYAARYALPCSCSLLCKTLEGSSICPLRGDAGSRVGTSRKHTRRQRQTRGEVRVSRPGPPNTTGSQTPHLWYLTAPRGSPTAVYVTVFLESRLARALVKCP